MSEGIKADQGKERLDLISPVALLEMSHVLAFGAKKYADWNWSKGLNYTRILAAMLRHTFKYMMGETLDPETGRSHIASVMVNCMFILHFEKFRPDLDDRQIDAYKILVPGTVLDDKDQQDPLVNGNK